MYAPEFDYHKASSVAEAIQLLGAHEGAKLLAGGHALIPLLKLRLARPPALIDISGIAELKGITVNDGTIRIGPLTTHWRLLRRMIWNTPTRCWRKRRASSGTLRCGTGAPLAAT